MENSKRNWKLSEKAKNPRSQWEIGCGKIENLLKAAEIILFFLKKSSPPLPNSKKRQKQWASGWENRPKMVGQHCKTVSKNWLAKSPIFGDTTKKTVTSFSSQSYVWVLQKRYPVLIVENQRCREILLFSFAEGPLQHPFQILCSCNFPRP